jgi:hypothetical protein
MNALFGFLVDKVGTKTFIDPVTKEDPLLNLVDFFAQPSIQKISRQSSEGTTFINSKDIAKYLGNHFDSAGSFKKTSDVILNFQNSQIPALVIQELKKYTASKKALPQTFKEDEVRKLYVEIKSTGDKVEEKTAEYLLYIFKSLKMCAESIDLCQNYHTIVKGYDSEATALKSEIRNYYMSDSLMDLPLASSGNHYYKLLEQAVFPEGSSSPAYLASMTKAYLRDGNVDHALKFFESGIHKRRQMSEN